MSPELAQGAIALPSLHHQVPWTFPQVENGSILDPKWIHPHHGILMPVNLSIKNVPDALAQQLRERAARAHRSLQGELMAILEEAVCGPEPLTPSEALERIRSWELETRASAASVIRRDRDAR
jgi:plasmid stability protein